MIDIATEQLLSINQATVWLAQRLGGRRPHMSTLYRWMEGVRGVRLEYVQVGRVRFVSVQALQRFCEGLTDPAAPRRFAPFQSDHDNTSVPL